MAKQTVDIGTSPNYGDGDPLRTAFRKINENFDELYAGNFAAPDQTASSIIPSANATYDLGSSDYKWADLHVADFIYLNGVRLSAGEGKLYVQNDIVQRTDTVGSIFADDSTLMVDGISGLVVGDVVNSNIDTDILTGANITASVDIETPILTTTNLTASGVIDFGNSRINWTGAQFTDFPSSLFLDINGSVFGDDSTVIVDAVNSSINLDGTVKGNIVPDTDVAYDIGSATKRFRDLYLSGSTIDLGGTTLSIVGGELQLGGVKIPTQSEVDSAVANASPTGDLTGSVFADDSSIMIDGVAGKIVGAIDTAQQAIFQDSIVLQNGNDIVTLGDGYGASFQLPNKSFSILGGGVDGGSYNIAFTSNGSGSILVGKQFNILGGEAIHIGTATGLTINNTVTVDAAVTAPSFVGDVTGSVFADDSSIMVDAVSNKLNASEIDIIGSGNAFQVYDGGFNWVTGGNMNLVVGGIGGIGSTGDLTINSSSGTVFVTNAQVTGDLIGNVIGNVTGNTNGTHTGNVTGDLTGSVFADDSSIMVDSVAGKITGEVENGRVTTDIVRSETDANLYVYAGGTGSVILAGQSDVSIGHVAGEVDIYGGVEFNNGTTAFQSGNSVDFNCPVDFNGTVNFDDAIIDWVPIVSGVLVNNGLPILPTQTLDISGSVFADDSTLLVDAVNGNIPGYVSLATLKAEVAASTNFADFQARIAAL